MRRLGVFLLALAAFPGCFATVAPDGGLNTPEIIGACNPTPCIRAAIGDVPTLPADLSSDARAAISDQVAQALYAPLESDEPQKTDEKLMAELVERYEEFTQPGFTDAPIDWEITRTASILFQNPEVLTIEVRSEGFVGGAHGFRDRKLFSFEPKSGKRLSLAELIEPSSERIFHQIVETQFRRAREVPEGKSLSDAGFFVAPGEEMPVPDNFGLIQAGLLVQYNEYEVAPYVFGPTEVVVPMEALQGVVRSGSKGILSSIESSQKRG